MVYRTCHNKLHKQDKIMYSCKLKNKCNTPHDTIEILQVLVFSWLTFSGQEMTSLQMESISSLQILQIEFNNPPN